MSCSELPLVPGAIPGQGADACVLNTEITDYPPAQGIMTAKVMMTKMANLPAGKILKYYKVIRKNFQIICTERED